MASSVAAPTDLVTGRAKAHFTRPATLGFGLMSSGMALWVVGAAVAGQDIAGDMMFLVVAAVVPLVLAALEWRLRSVGKGIALALGALAMVGMFWVAFSLAMPRAFIEFSGAVMWFVGGFAAIGYSVAAIVKRGDLRTEATAGERRAMRVIVAIVALAMASSALLNLTTRSGVDPAAAAGATTVGMSNFAFAPATYEATAGETATFLVHNSDAFTHDFAIEALGVNSGMLSPGSSKLIEVNAPAGEYKIRCTLHSSSGTTIEDGDMAATLTVK